MANRRDFFFRQKVTEAELDVAFAELEQADRYLATDLGLVGVAIGMVVAQQASPNMTVQVSGPGVVYDQTGQRIAIPSTQNVNCAVDEDALSTAVVTPGNSRILSIFAEFDRVLSDPRVDGNAATVYFVRSESYVFNVAKGVEGVGPTAPALRGDQILLADITIAFGATTIVTGDISTTRREWMFKLTGTVVTVGSPEEALQALATAIATDTAGLAAHIADAVDAHLATAIGYAGGAVWADSTTNPATTVEAQLDKIITDLTSTSGNRGAGKLTMPAGSAWADGTVNGATRLDSFIARIISDLAGTGGLQKIGPLSSTNEILYSAARSRRILIPVTDFSPGITGAEYRPGLSGLTSHRILATANNCSIGVGLNKYLRHGQVITGLRLLVDPGAARASGSGIRAYINYAIPDFAGPTAGYDPILIDSEEDDASASVQLISMTGLSHTVVREGATARDYYIVVVFGNTAGASNDSLYGIELTVDDPGPRNF